MLPANLEREISAAAQIRNLQARVRRLETLEGAGAGCLALIEDVIPVADVTSIEFTSIPQIYKHLWLLLRTASVTNFQIFMTFNGITTSSYDWELMSGVAISSGSLDTRIVVGGGGTNGWVLHEINIIDYVRTRGGAHAIWKGGTLGGAPIDTVFQGFGRLRTEVAVSSIKLETSTGAYIPTQSRFSLYGLC